MAGSAMTGPHLDRLYGLLHRAEARHGRHLLADCDGRMGWPERGVYFFFEPGEVRADGTPRVTRIGTHALESGSRTTLWNRLSNHRGTARSRSGNHRGSIFRLLVGDALLRRDGVSLASWGLKSSPGAAAKALGVPRDDIKASEADMERAVSRYLGAMPFVVVDIPDEAGPDSARGRIERGAIALLARAERPSPTWLGRHSSRPAVRTSGLWNQNHVDDGVDVAFLDELAAVLA